MQPTTPPLKTDDPAPMPPLKQDPPIRRRNPRDLFSGRLNRLGFLLANVYWGLIFSGLLLLWVLVNLNIRSTMISAVIGIVIGLIVLVMAVVWIVLYFSFLVKRFHDIGQSGWLALLTLIPGASSILFIVMLAIPGTPGPNGFGETPQKSLGFRDVSGL